MSSADFYVIKCLYVYFDTDDFFTIELYKDKKYFLYDFSENDKDYETKINEYNKNILIPQLQPIIIYDNRNFKNTIYQNKYNQIVEIYLIKYHKSWNDIIKIIIVEERKETKII